MTTHPQKKHLAFFGATGDCANSCLAAALRSGYTCTALARTPSKLTTSLKTKNVPTNNLTIVQGDAKNLSAVKETLSKAEIIISGIGGTPTMQWSLWQPVTLTDPTICQDAGKVILQAAREVGKKPFLINISTTGIWAPGCPRDVPLLFLPLYRWGLAVPHHDKEILEKMLREEVQKSVSEKAIGGYVNVKPSLLMDGEGLGVGKVRAGGEKKPAVGYTIQRRDVGEWIFERLVNVERVEEGWVDGSVCITY